MPNKAAGALLGVLNAPESLVRLAASRAAEIAGINNDSNVQRIKDATKLSTVF